MPDARPSRAQALILALAALPSVALPRPAAAEERRATLGVKVQVVERCEAGRDGRDLVLAPSCPKAVASSMRVAAPTAAPASAAAPSTRTETVEGGVRYLTITY